MAGQGAQMSLGNSQIGAGLNNQADELESQREGLNQAGAASSAKATSSGLGALIGGLASF
jgi:hypothetical protein